MRNLIKLFGTVLIIILFANQANAQDYYSRNYSKNSWRSQRSEANVSLGFMPIYPVEMIDDYIYSIDDRYENSSRFKTIETPSFNFGLSYKLTRMIAFGANAFFASKTTETYANYDNSVLLDHSIAFFGISPYVRFDWINTKYFNLYSALGLGAGISFERESVEGASETNIQPVGTATIIGVKVGRTIYAFSDLSAANHGALRAGIGWRF